MAFPAEFGLATACCRWPPSSARDESVSKAATGVDWEHFLRVARRHRVEALAEDALRRAGVAVPAKVAKKLLADARTIVSLNLVFAAEARRVSDLLTAEGIRHLFLKGLTLNMLAYGSLGLKRSCDIDLLVDPEQYGAACDTLAASGYYCVLPGRSVSRRDLLEFAEAEKDTSWQHQTRPVKVELHQRLLANPLLLPGVGLSSPTQTVEIASGVRLETLAKEELFAYLCAHGALTAWSRLKWLADLCALLKNDDPAEIERLYRRTQRDFPCRAAAAALLLGHRLLALPLSRELVAELERDGMTRWLVRMALGTMLQGDAATELHEKPMGTWRIHASIFFLEGGWRYKCSEVKRKFKVVKARRILLLDALRRPPRSAAGPA